MHLNNWQNFPVDIALAYRGEQIITRGEFLSHVKLAASSLPPGRHLINLCDDRYLFMVTFFAALLRNKINLLPPNRAPDTIVETLCSYADSFCVSDVVYHNLTVPVHKISWSDFQGENLSLPQFSLTETQTAAIVFTSGSTGKSKANLKTWGSLWRGAQLLEKRLFVAEGTVCTLIATVPPQHMYGLETSVLLPVLSRAVVCSGRPFFPTDICEALQNVPDRKILVTTPVHLRSCVNTSLEWPAVDYILSATAPMSDDLAVQVERQFNTKLLEIFGASEMGSIASKRSLAGSVWELFDTLVLSSTEKKNFVSGGHLPHQVEISDQVEVIDATHFRLIGRPEDMINVAGKRASLAELNSRLLSIPGIKDGMYYIPASVGQKTVVRPSVIIVATEISDEEILCALRKTLDPVFLPRPIVRVDKLPRNDVGKLSVAEVRRLVTELAIDGRGSRRDGSRERANKDVGPGLQAEPGVRSEEAGSKTSSDHRAMQATAGMQEVKALAATGQSREQLPGAIAEEVGQRMEQKKPGLTLPRAEKAWADIATHEK